MIYLHWGNKHTNKIQEITTLHTVAVSSRDPGPWLHRYMISPYWSTSQSPRVAGFSQSQGDILNLGHHQPQMPWSSPPSRPKKRLFCETNSPRIGLFPLVFQLYPTTKCQISMGSPTCFPHFPSRTPTSHPQKSWLLSSAVSCPAPQEPGHAWRPLARNQTTHRRPTKRFPASTKGRHQRSSEW